MLNDFVHVEVVVVVCSEVMLNLFIKLRFKIYGAKFSQNFDTW